MLVSVLFLGAIIAIVVASTLLPNVVSVVVVILLCRSRFR